MGQDFQMMWNLGARSFSTSSELLKSLGCSFTSNRNKELCKLWYDLQAILFGQIKMKKYLQQSLGELTR